ncbi:MAG: AAA family ATPase [Methanobrevibacter sp.]|nr:AAA family ATPase [Methanobrevibacter sp.]
MAKKKKTGLGRGLDSLIPDFPEDDENEADSSLTLEDMLEENNKDKEEEDNKKAKEKKINKKTKSKKTATEVSNSLENVEITDVKKPKTTAKETVTENLSTNESIEDEIETNNQVESSKISNETESSISKPQQTQDIENIETPSETSKPVAIENKPAEVAKNTETKPSSPEESENTVENIKDNLTEREKQSIDDVIKIIGKNPRITLWSAKSAAVFRYLRKTEPEFSISKEASKLIDEAVQSKYPEIWALFKDIEK